MASDGAEEPPTFEERARGCLLGLALGDALGTTVEFLPPGSFTPLTEDELVGGGKFSLLPGQWTDDTSMALCLAEALARTGGWDDHAVLSAWRAWLDEAHLSSNCRFIDVGAATQAALHAAPSAANAATRGGNGGLMRLPPLAIFLAASPHCTPSSSSASTTPSSAPLSSAVSAAIAACAHSCRLTHAHPAAIDSCRYFAALLLGALHGASKPSLLSPLYTPPGGDALWAEGMAAEAEAVARGSFWRCAPRGDGFAPASLEAALWAFAHTQSFAEGAVRVANLGGDADTTAAIYGALAGAYYSQRGLPTRWQQQLFFEPLISFAADALTSLGASSPSPSPSPPASTSDFLQLLHLHTLLERAYAPLIAKLSPGPGPPLCWPGGFASAAAFRHATRAAAAASAAAAAAAAAALPPPRAARLREAHARLLADFERQWAHDEARLAAAVERRPAVAGMLAQLRSSARRGGEEGRGGEGGGGGEAEGGGVEGQRGEGTSGGEGHGGGEGDGGGGGDEGGEKDEGGEGDGGRGVDAAAGGERDEGGEGEGDSKQGEGKAKAGEAAAIRSSTSAEPPPAPPPGDELLVAAMRGEVAVVERWLAAGGQIDAAAAADGSTLLMRAASLGLAELVALLLRRRAALDATDVWGATALTRGAARGAEEVCALLLRAGASAAVETCDGKRAADVARANGHRGVYEMLRREAGDAEGGSGGGEERGSAGGEEAAAAVGKGGEEAVAEAVAAVGGGGGREKATVAVGEGGEKAAAAVGEGGEEAAAAVGEGGEEAAAAVGEGGEESASAVREGGEESAAAARRGDSRLGGSEAHRLRGNQLFAQQDFRGAEEAYSLALAAALAEGGGARRRAAVALSNRAACFLQMDQLAKALADAELAVEMDGAYAKAHYRRGVALERAGRAREAREAKRRARELEAAEKKGEGGGGGGRGGGGEGGEGGEAERVARVVEELRGTAAGSEARRALVAELRALLERVSSGACPKQAQREVARSFVDAEGPEVLYEIESSMRGNWMADAKNGTLGNISQISRLPGAIGQAFFNYRGLNDQNKQAAADRTCTHPSHAGIGVQPQRAKS